MPVTFVSTLNGNFGSLSLHANFVWHNNLARVCDNNIIRAFEPFTAAGRQFYRQRTQADITLAGHPTSIGTWGFCNTANNEWAILTREHQVGSTIGKVRVYSLDGSSKELEFDIPNQMAGLDPQPMRAPKSLSYLHGHYIVRVVRGVVGNMRFLVWDDDGNLMPDLTITLSESTPTSLRDAASGDDSPLYVYDRGTTVGVAYAIDPGTGDEITAESVRSADIAGGEAISIDGDRLYVADLTEINVYTGVPQIANPFPQPSSGGGGGGFGIFQAMVTNAMLGRNMNLREQRRRDEERRRRLGG